MKRRKRNLSECFPILEITPNGIISKRGDYTAVLELTKPEIFTLSTEQLNAWHETWIRAIRILPSPSILHMQDWYREAAWQAAQDKPAAGPGNDEPPFRGFLGEASDHFFHEHPYLDHRCYLFLTYRAAKGRSPGHTPSTLLQPHLLPANLLSPAAIREFEDRVGQFERILTDSKLVGVRRVIGAALKGDGGVPGIVEQYFQLESPAVLKDISFDDQIHIGDAQGLVFTMADADHLPARCSSHVPYPPFSNEQTPFPLGFASALGVLLDCNHIVNTYIFIDDPRQAIQRLERKRRIHRALSQHSRENALAGSAIDTFLDEALTGQHQYVKAHLNIFSWNDNPAAIGGLKTKVSAAIAKLGATPKLEIPGAPQIWWAGIPGNAADLPFYETFDTFVEQVSCFLIPDTNYDTSLSPFGIRLGDRITGKPVHVDITEEPMQARTIKTRNKFVIGGSGSGKSFFTNHLMRSYYEQGCHILIVDIGHSYRGLCRFVDGYYFTCSDTSLISFNPFWQPDGEPPDLEKKESIKTLLLALWKKDDEPFLRSEYVALSNAIHAYYQWVGQQSEIFPCFNSFYDFLQERFVQVIDNEQVKEKDFDIRNFLYVLRPYYSGGEYDYLLNAQENLDLFHQRFIVFELDQIKDHPILFPVTTIILMEVYLHKMRRLPGVRKVILIEEAWKAIARTSMSEYIQYLFRTVRKFYGEAIVVTQEIEDILSSPVIKQTIVNNADCKILMDIRQFRNRFDQVRALLDLTEHDAALVGSVNKAIEPGKNYKEVFINLGGKCSKVYRTEVSLEEYLTYTTEESEKLQVETYAARHGSYRAGIVALAHDMRMKLIKHIRKGLVVLFCGLLLCAPSGEAKAQLGIIGAILRRVIMNVDLQVQRLQSKTLLLQVVARKVENAMQGSKLAEIADWTERQKDLYQDYFRELWEVKQVIADEAKVKDILTRQARFIRYFKKARSSLLQDPHFSAGEMDVIAQRLDGLFRQCLDLSQELPPLITAMLTQMDDGERLRRIAELDVRTGKMEQVLGAFVQDQVLSSLRRSGSRNELEAVRKLYGIRE